MLAASRHYRQPAHGSELTTLPYNHEHFIGYTCRLQGQAALETKIALQPASLNSRLHTRLTAAVDRRHTKVHKVSTLHHEDYNKTLHYSPYHFHWTCCYCLRRSALQQLSVTLPNRRIIKSGWKRSESVAQPPFKRNRFEDKPALTCILVCS